MDKICEMTDRVFLYVFLFLLFSNPLLIILHTDLHKFNDIAVWQQVEQSCPLGGVVAAEVEGVQTKPIRMATIILQILDIG